MAKIKCERWKCKFCGTEGWCSRSGPAGLAPPQQDHDRPDGRRCIRAAKMGAALDASNVAAVLEVQP